MVGDEAFATLGRVVKYHEDFKPIIADYCESDMAKYPCNNTIAKFK